MVGFSIMACIKVGGDDLEQYYVDLIQTYDKEVNRQYKEIKKLKQELEEEKGDRDYYQAIVESWE